MTDSKHTPGPWVAGLYGEELCVYATETQDGRAGVPIKMPRTEADQRLIAAAPELLAALEKLMDLRWNDDDMRAARAAIARAKEEVK